MGDDDSNLQFPWKLHVVLDQAERDGLSKIISWLPEGDAFMVHDKDAFADSLMPEYFHSKKFKTFQRNLNLWGFRTLTKNPNKGAIFHPDFLRSNPDRCRLMKRIRIKKKSPRMSLAEFQATIQDTAKAPPSPTSTSSQAKMSAHKTTSPNVAPRPAPTAALAMGNTLPLANNTAADHHQMLLLDNSRISSGANSVSTASSTAQSFPSLAWNCLAMDQLRQQANNNANQGTIMFPNNLAQLLPAPTIDLHDLVKLQLGLALLEAKNAQNRDEHNVFAAS